MSGHPWVLPPNSPAPPVVPVQNASWATRLEAIDALSDCRFDRGLIDDMERTGGTTRPLALATPSFQAYATSELASCCRSRYPVFSVTGGACALQCAHCEARILAPMIPATTPDSLDRQVRDMAARQSLGGFLLSGGSNRRNEIAYERFYPVINRLKRDMPDLRIAVHSALLDRGRARAMAEAGVDTAMMDMIGADETIRDIYNLDRSVADFEGTLAALAETTMSVVPHIVIGLHFGRLLGEQRALDIVARHPVDGLVLVVVMPVHARPGAFATPEAGDVGRLMLEARKRLPDRRVTLGCARPHGRHRRTVDAYAVMAGLDGIAFPAEGSIALARSIGRPIAQHQNCCAIRPRAGAVVATVGAA